MGLSCLLMNARTREQLYPPLLGGKPLSLSLLLAVPPQQLAIDFGDLLQVVFQRMVVLNPGANPLDMLGADDAARCAACSQGDGEVPHRTVSLAACALTRGITAGHIALDQRAAEDLRHRRQEFCQSLLTLAQGEFRKPA